MMKTRIIIATVSAAAALAACSKDETPQEMVLEPPKPGLVAKPRWLTFTCVKPGCDSTRVASITVVGERDIAVKRVVMSDETRTDFAFETSKTTPFILKRGTSFEIRGTYRPTGDPRLSDADVIITYTDASPEESEDRIPPGELSIPLVRRLVGEPKLAVDPERLVFGGVEVRQQKTLPLEILNSGFGNVGVVVESVASDSQVFTVGELPQYAVLPEERFGVEVTYKPLVEEYTEGIITVTSADTRAEPVLVGVAGTSIPRPTIGAIPDTGVNFGEVPLGTMAMQQFEIVNLGADVLEIFRMEIDGTSGGANLEAKLADGTSTATIGTLNSRLATLKLNATVPGPIDAFVRIVTNDRAHRNFELPVTGLVVRPQIQVTPVSHDYGIVPRGWVLSHRIEVENIGYGPLVVDTVTKVLGSSDLFTIQGLPMLPAMLQHNERMAFQVEFRSEAQAQFNATLAITSNDPDRMYVEIPLTARGASCEEACPVPHGTPSCASGECSIGSCDIGWYDTDRAAATGCECAEIGRDPGAFCADGYWAGALEDGNGDRATFNGVLATEGDVDIITFYAVDESQFFGDDYDVRVRLETPDPTIEMCVYRHNTGAHDNACYWENESCSRDFRRDGSWGRDDEADYTVKVFRRSGVAPTCTSYTVFMRNG